MKSPAPQLVKPRPALLTHPLLGAEHPRRDELAWERHGEFFSFTFIMAGQSPKPFSEPPVLSLPAGWLASAGARVEPDSPVSLSLPLLFGLMIVATRRARRRLTVDDRLERSAAIKRQQASDRAGQA